MIKRITGGFALLTLSSLLTAPAYAQASLTGSGYTQNFDGLGTGGTTLPTGFTIRNLQGNNGTFTAANPPDSAAVAASTQAASQTLAIYNQTSAPTVLTVAGNGGATATSTDRSLVSSPTNVGGKVLALQLINNTASTLSGINFSYDLEVLTTPSAAEDVPGFRFFYSLSNGTTASDWTPVPGLTLSNTALNSVGTANTSILFPTLVSAGSSMFFRWVDDNSAFSSPDHMYGLDNIRVTGISSGTAAPEPGTLGFLAIGLVAFAARRRR